jgi:1,4-alpha-glucan branching enzyme
MKWNMGWMHDMLYYFSRDPVYRRYEQNNVTFGLLYAFNENFVLPISHDEVVYGKRSLLDKMPGDEWQRFANARAFLAFMMGHPGKKLLFMGSDIGQHTEWNHNQQVQWELLVYEPHQKLQDLVRTLHSLYKSHPAMYEVDFHHSGFEWVDFRDADNSILAFLRFSEGHRSALLFCCNFTPVPRHGYRFGVPFPGFYREVLNTDSELFWGSNVGNSGGVSADPIKSHDRPYSISITLPPLAVVAFEVPITPR